MSNINKTNDSMELKTYTVAEAAVLIGISKDKIYEFLRAGKLPHLKMGMCRIRHQSLVKLLDELESTEYWEGGLTC